MLAGPLKFRKMMTYQITIETPVLTYRIEGSNKRRLKKAAQRLLDEIKIEGKISKTKVVTPQMNKDEQ